MREQGISRIEKRDVEPPEIKPGGTAIVFQRHEKYQRERGTDTAGSILPEAAEEVREKDTEFFEKVISSEGDSETMVLFTSSDTQYDHKGFRSLETAEIAQEAAIEVMNAHGLDPKERVINLNEDFNTLESEETGQKIRPMPKLREPQIFDGDLRYIEHLRNKYGAGDAEGNGLSPEAFMAHESDEEKEVREKYGTEGIYDILDRTKKAMESLIRYARMFHKQNPNKKLIIWAASHYDTISPFVKDAADISFKEYVPVDYGGGVIVSVGPENEDPVIELHDRKIPLNPKDHKGPKNSE